MEAVRERRPKLRERSRASPEAPQAAAPPLPPRTRLEAALPNVPSTAPTAHPRVSAPRSASPEPEEISLDEVSAISAPEETSTSVAPPVQPRHYVLPRVNGNTREASTDREASPAQAPPLPPKTRTALPTVAPAYPALDSMPSPTVATASRDGLPSYSDLTRQSSEKSAWMPSVPRVDLTAPPLYPELASSSAALLSDTTEHGLLTENALLSFYHNPLYEAVEDDVDRFVMEEERPNGPLFALLTRFKKVCEDIMLSEIEETEKTAALRKCLNDLWLRQQKTQTHHDKCGEGKEGSGAARFEVATISTEKLDEMKKLLAANRATSLNKRMSQEVEARALALQVQWIVISMNHSFLAEHGLTTGSPPLLVESAAVLSSRVRLRAGLSDLFAHLRFPQLPPRFLDAVVAWITELTCILHKKCLCSDGIFLLLHVLRLPSPISSWAPQLIQTFAQSSSPTKLKVDFCIAMLSQLMSQIRSRESFLSSLNAAANETGESWMVVDEDGEEHNPVRISEADLAALLEQLPISDFYSLAFVQFSSSNEDQAAQFVSLIAFQLVLMKIMQDGLSTYSQLGFRGFCRQIGMALRKSVRELSSRWRVSRDLLPSNMERQLQREVDRVVLLAVQYIVSKQSLGLWQYLVDLPYDCISDECILRVEFLLRKGGANESSKSVRELYDIPAEQLMEQIKPGSIAERLDKVGDVDTVFVVSALAALISQSARDPTPFLREIIQVCFVDANTRDSLYKVGSEAVGMILSRKPSCLDALLTIIDRNIDHMEEHALSIFSSSPLELCRVSEGTVGGVIGKWLMARSPERAGNRVARRVLSSLNWGYEDEAGERLWMSERVHFVCADTILKSHHAHCAQSNGLIAKSVNKIAKLASKIPDYEQQFNQFCWDLLIKLKLPLQTSTASPQADLAAYFLHVFQHSLATPESLAEPGLNYISELANAGCIPSCVVLLARAFALHHDKMESVLGHKNFISIFERVLHADQSSYAYQLLVGPSATPTLIVRLISCAITFYASVVPDLGGYLRRWVDALCLRRALTFNSDQVTLQLLGTITRLAFERDSRDLFGIKDIISNAYTQQLAAWANGSKGLFSLFSANQPPPPLIASSHVAVSAWASYLLLLVEQSAMNNFHVHLYDALGKKDKTTLEDALKKASSKQSYALPLERLHVFRWAELIRACGTGEREKEVDRDMNVLCLAVQQLVTTTFTPRTSNGKRQQLARRYYESAAAAPLWRSLEERLSSIPPSSGKGLPRAALGWLKASVEISMPSFNDYARFDLDYLLQLVIAEDPNIWTDPINMLVISNQDLEESRFYSATCHERGRIHQSATGTVSVVPSLLSDRASSRAVPFPTLPAHPGLPPAPTVDRSVAVQPTILAESVKPLLVSISKLAVQFVTASDETEYKDKQYCELLTKLYKPAVINVNVVIRCRGQCPTPNTSTLQVSATQFCSTTDAALTKNRDERIAVIAALQSAVTDPAAVQAASIEYIAREVCLLALTAPQQLRQSTLQAAGRGMFFLIASSVASADSSPILFPPATSALENTLATLGKEFIRLRPEEQIPVMKLVLDGFVLSDPLVASFTPECVSANSLVEIYRQLSDAVARPELSQRALMLLSRLSISRATDLPPNQFRPLMPLAFRNVTSSTGAANSNDCASPLAELCLSHFLHFLFHQFPVNFVFGLELTLNGCSEGITPVTVLETIVKKLARTDKKGQRTSSEYEMDAANCRDCLSLCGSSLSHGHSHVSTLFTRWQRYLPALGALVQYFIGRTAEANFNPESPLSLIQNEMTDTFGRLTGVFSPLIAPSLPSVPPFSPSSQEAACAFLERFVDIINALPYNAAIPPGELNTLSLVWKFYCEKLTPITHLTLFYHGVLESALVRLHWPSFWPTLRALEATEDVLSSRSPDCAPFISQVIVRIPWLDVLSMHVPNELRPSYLAMLGSVLVRLGAKTGNIFKVRASFCELLKILTARVDWSCVEAEQAEKLAESVAVLLPHDALANPTEATAMLQIIWRKMCVFTSSRDACGDASTLLKQRAFLRAELRLAIRIATPQAALPVYNSLISDTSTVASQQERLRSYCMVARELTAIWTEISDVKLGETLVSGWMAYLDATPSSPLVLTCLATVLSSLKDDQYSTGLRVLDSALAAYFKRPNATWDEVITWAFFPENLRANCAKYLLTVPNSSTSIPVLSLVLKAFFACTNQPASVYEQLLYYVTSLKPKYVKNESSFCVEVSVLLSWLLGEASSSSAAAPSPSTISKSLSTLLDWLKRLGHESGGGGLLGAIGFGKNSFSPKLRCLLQILELYLHQQILSGEKSPELRLRRADNMPVLNSRIAAFKELKGQKANQSFSAAFSVALPFFTQVERNHVGQAAQLWQMTAATLFGQPKYLLT